MHWFWRAAIAVCVTSVYHCLNMIYPPVTRVQDRIDDGLRMVFSALVDRDAMPSPNRPAVKTTWPARVSRTIAFSLPLAVIPLAVYGVLTRLTGPSRPKSEGETRCRKCGYILRGISEPRCSECGERI